MASRSRRSCLSRRNWLTLCVNKPMIRYRHIFVIFCLLLVWGCGYQLTGSKAHLPPGITSIAIPTFVNETYEPGVEIQFTQAFLNDFINDRRVKVVDKAQADSVLEGTI